jgi:hypothetical protein
LRLVELNLKMFGYQTLIQVPNLWYFFHTWKEIDVMVKWVRDAIRTHRCAMTSHLNIDLVLFSSPPKFHCNELQENEGI